MSRLDETWLAAASERVSRHFQRDLDALVAISSPSGDVPAAEEVCALIAALLPDAAEIDRPPCSTPGYAPDLLATVRGTGSGRLLLLGHLDTVVAHDGHRPLERRDGKLIGSGSVDMKGGVAISLGVMRELAAMPEEFAELCLLTVVDEEWRTGGFDHGPRFAGWDACLCFEAGQVGPDGAEAVVAKRKAAGDAAGARPRRRRALGVGAGEGPQRAARPRRGRAGGGGALGPGRRRPADREPDRPSQRRGLQRRPGRTAN